MILADVTTTIQLGPILTQLAEFVGTVLMAVAGWALKNVADHYKISTQSALFQNVLGAVDRGIAYGQTVVAQKASTASVNVQSAVAAEAANYVLTKVPGALSSLGMTPQHVADLVTARLPQPNPVPQLPAAAVPQPNPAPQ